MKNNILIFSTHMDDEVLSCASFLEKDLENVTIFYHNNIHPVVGGKVIQDENEKLISFLGCDKRLSNIRSVNRLDTVATDDLINEYENVIKSVSPHTIILPFPSYNQDHRAVYMAALTVLRPHDKVHFVKKVLLSEQPETFGVIDRNSLFKPIYYRKLDIDRKIKLNKFYQSQLRGHRSLDFIGSIAKVRGNQSNYEYAEAFEVLRWVE
jgi:N-acetylglucosamine malate deacetylase 1